MEWFTTKRVEANSNWETMIRKLHEAGYSEARTMLELITMKAVAIMNACYSKLLTEDIGHQRAGLRIEPDYSTASHIVYSNGFNAIVYNVKDDKWYEPGNAPHNQAWFTRQYKENEHITNTKSVAHNLAQMNEMMLEGDEELIVKDGKC